MTRSYHTTLTVDAPEDYFSWTIVMPVIATLWGLLYPSGYHFVISGDATHTDRSPLEQDAWQAFDVALGQRNRITDYVYENPMKGLLESVLGEHSIATTLEEFEEGGELLPAGVTLGGGDVPTIIMGPFPDMYRFVYGQILQAYKQVMQPLIDANAIYSYSIQPLGMPQFEEFVQSESGEARSLAEGQAMAREIGKLKNLIETSLGPYPTLLQHYMELVDASYGDIPPRPDARVDLAKSDYVDQLFGDDWLVLKAMLAFDDETLALLEEVHKLPTDDRHVVQDALSWILDSERWEKLLSDTRQGQLIMPRPSQMTEARRGLRQVDLGSYVDSYEDALVEGIGNLLDASREQDEATSTLIYDILPIYQQYDLPAPIQQSLDQLEADVKEEQQTRRIEREEEIHVQSLKAGFWNYGFAYGDLSVVPVQLHNAPYGSVEEETGYAPELSEEEFVRDAEHFPASVDLDDIREEALHAAYEELSEKAYEEEEDEEGRYEPDESELSERIDEIVTEKAMAKAWEVGLVTLAVDYDHRVIEVTYFPTFSETARKLIGEVIRANTVSYSEYEYEGKEAPFDRGSNWTIRMYEMDDDEAVLTEVPMFEAKRW